MFWHFEPTLGVNWAIFEGVGVILDVEKLPETKKKNSTLNFTKKTVRLRLRSDMIATVSKSGMHAKILPRVWRHRLFDAGNFLIDIWFAPSIDRCFVAFSRLAVCFFSAYSLTCLTVNSAWLHTHCQLIIAEQQPNKCCAGHILSFSRCVSVVLWKSGGGTNCCV